MRVKPEGVGEGFRKSRTGHCALILRWRGRSGDRARGRGYVIYSASEVLPLCASHLERVRVVADRVGGRV